MRVEVLAAKRTIDKSSDGDADASGWEVVCLLLGQMQYDACCADVVTYNADVSVLGAGDRWDHVSCVLLELRAKAIRFGHCFLQRYYHCVKQR